MIRTCVVLLAVLAVISTSDYETYRPRTRPTFEPEPSSESPLDKLKEAFENLLHKTEEAAHNLKYAMEGEAADFAGEVEESVVDRIVGLAELIAGIDY
eukprot:sb/3478908/